VACTSSSAPTADLYDGPRRSNLKDLRSKITFIPDALQPGRMDAESRATPPSRPSISTHRTTKSSRAIFRSSRRCWLFENELVRTSLLKFQAILNEVAPDDSIYAETLGFLFTRELSRLGRKAPLQALAIMGRPDPRQVRQVVEYIMATSRTTSPSPISPACSSEPLSFRAHVQAVDPGCRRIELSHHPPNRPGEGTAWRSASCRSPTFRAGPAFAVSPSSRARFRRLVGTRHRLSPRPVLSGAGG